MFLHFSIHCPTFHWWYRIDAILLPILLTFSFLTLLHCQDTNSSSGVDIPLAPSWMVLKHANHVKFIKLMYSLLRRRFYYMTQSIKLFSLFQNQWLSATMGVSVTIMEVNLSRSPRSQATWWLPPPRLSSIVSSSLDLSRMSQRT